MAYVFWFRGDRVVRGDPSIFESLIPRHLLRVARKKQGRVCYHYQTNQPILLESSFKTVSYSHVPLFSGAMAPYFDQGGGVYIFNRCMQELAGLSNTHTPTFLKTIIPPKGYTILRSYSE